MTRLLSHHGGWLKQPDDPRDHIFRATVADVARLPGKVSLRNEPWNGPVLDQGRLGTCVPNSNADMYRDVLGIEGHAQFLPSRLYIYAAGRTLEGTPLAQDTGMYVRDALKVLAQGVPPEDDDPYSDANPGPFQQSITPQQQAAATSHAIDYSQLVVGRSGPVLRACLAAGYPFTFGFEVPAALESKDMATGNVKVLSLPGPNDQFIGGHGVKCIGYDFTETVFPVPVFEIKNSWNFDWCDSGYFFMDYRFFSPFHGGDPLATDIWTIRLTS
jgi:C1A family cysteine protease